MPHDVGLGIAVEQQQGLAALPAMYHVDGGAGGLDPYSREILSEMHA
ncbi:hypothetical protein [Marinobacter salicampi]